MPPADTEEPDGQAVCRHPGVPAASQRLSRWIHAADRRSLGAVSAASRDDKPAPSFEWKTYGGDLASTRYSPLDQINKDNFSKLKIAWRLKTDAFGPRPDTLYSATPLMVGSVLYTTAGTRARGRRAQRRRPARCCGCTPRTKGARGQNAAAQRRRPRRRVLVERRRIRSAHHLRHARLPDDRARRQDRRAGRRRSGRTASSI